MEPSASQITAILQRWSGGDQHALDTLTPLVYDDLRRLASYLLHNERLGHTLQPTALVNEAYLRLAGDAKVRWRNRSHFFAVAAIVMRRILVDYARSYRRTKRGGGVAKLTLDEALVFAPKRSDDLLSLDEALERLSSIDLRKAKVVELRFFGGLNNEEIAEILHISVNTVMRDWNMAKAWLRRGMDRGCKDAGPTLDKS